jgi:hypothetical protein
MVIPVYNPRYSGGGPWATQARLVRLYFKKQNTNKMAEGHGSNGRMLAKL